MFVYKCKVIIVLHWPQSQTVPPSEAVRERKHYERNDLKNFSLKELKALRTSLSKDVHGKPKYYVTYCVQLMMSVVNNWASLCMCVDLSSELVGRLLTRDQLRTEQDAMLQEVQDMASLWCTIKKKCFHSGSKWRDPSFTRLSMSCLN